MANHWFYAKGSQRIGPLTFDQLRRLCRSGLVRAGDYVFNEASSRWVPAGEVPSLVPQEAGEKLASAPVQASPAIQSQTSVQQQPSRPFPAVAVFVLSGIAALIVAPAIYWLMGAGRFSTFAHGQIRHPAKTAFNQGAGSAVVASRSYFADAGEITEAYRSYVVHIGANYINKESFLIWSTDKHQQISGTGLILANDQRSAVILTNRHVIDPSFGNNQEFRNLAVTIKLASANEWRPATICAVHPLLDLALLMTDQPFSETRAVEIIDHRAIRQGEAVVALGNPLGVEFVTTEGIVSKVADGMILHSCPINPGNSGGPLILKRSGLVAGINTMAHKEAQNFNFATCADQSLILDTPWHWLARKEETSQLLKLVRVAP